MTSKLVQMQARFQQRQMEEREEKLLRLYETQQRRAFERVGRGSAGSDGSVGSVGSTGGGGGGGKVRQMFDERRQKAGVDRSYPLQPLKSKSSTTRGRVAAASITSTTTAATTTSRTAAVKVATHRAAGVAKQTVVRAAVNGRRPEHVGATLNNNHNISQRTSSKEIRVDDEVDTSSDSHRTLIEMMNKHNINDNLEDEEIPTEFDDAFVTEDDNDFEKTNGNHQPVYKNNSNVTKKNTPTPEPKPIVRRSIIKTVSSPTGKAIFNSHKTSNNSATIASKPASQDMMKSKKAEKSPSSSRPSGKQPPRAPVVRDDLAECKYCGRRFATDRLDTHEDICAKTGKKKRKTYDATKHRVMGTELEPFVKKGSKNVSSKGGKASAATKKDWRKTHEEFISTIRAAKMAQEHIAKGGKLSDLPPPPPSSNPDYVQCPHCGRRFNETAAERHIPKCANYQFNKPKAAPSKGKASGKK